MTLSRRKVKRVKRLEVETSSRGAGLTEKNYAGHLALLGPAPGRAAGADLRVEPAGGSAELSF
ncbi:MAG: hypothetical protein VCA34_08270 [Roseibacillus sp.]